MVHRCVVHGCKNPAKHYLPRNAVQRSLWLKAMRFHGRIRKSEVICSVHFKETDYLDYDDQKRRYLKRHAVPSIFPWNVSKSPEKIKYIDTKDLSGISDSDSLSENENMDPLNPIIGSSSSVTSMIEKQLSTPSSSLDTENEDLLPFDAARLKSTYSKQNIPIRFVPEMPYIVTEGPAEDPLSEKGSSEEHAFCTELHEDVGNNVEIIDDYKTESNISDNEEEVDIQSTIPVCENCGRKSKIPLYGIHFFKKDNSAIHFYTGLESFEKLMFVFHSLGNSINNLTYFYGKPPAHLDPLEHFFMVLLILRRHREFEDLAFTFKTTMKQITNIFITWIRFMALQWRSIDLWIGKDLIKYYMPLDFNDKYPNTRVIIDATECPIKKPHLPSDQQITFSSYKNRNTVKFLIGIAPSGLVTYISPCYGGSATDRQIIERSTILDTSRFDPSDEIMVDKGLNVQDIFLSHNVKVNIPTFFKKGNHLNPATLTKDRKIASKRVHVERIIGMLKTYKILTQAMNHTETLLSSDITFVIAMLINFRSNIISNTA